MEENTERKNKKKALIWLITTIVLVSILALVVYFGITNTMIKPLKITYLGANADNYAVVQVYNPTKDENTSQKVKASDFSFQVNGTVYVGKSLATYNDTAHWGTEISIRAQKEAKLLIKFEGNVNVAQNSIYYKEDKIISQFN